MFSLKTFSFMIFRNTSCQTRNGLPVSQLYWSSGSGWRFLMEKFSHGGSFRISVDDSLWLLYCKFPHGSLFLIFLFQLVATLPDDVQPGPDFYGLPWKPVLITAFLGVVSFAIFFWRTVLVVSKLNLCLDSSRQRIFYNHWPFCFFSSATNMNTNAYNLN